MTQGPTSALLSPTTVGDHLHRRGVLGDGPWSARTLAGGVSNVVLEVRQGDRAYVVKQSLGRLRVTDAWFAPRERLLAEAAGIRACAALTPGYVPDVIDVDPHDLVLVISRAPARWRDWKSRLLTAAPEEGSFHAAVGARLGTLLRTWHSATAERALDPEIEHAAASFEALRLGPYHETVARRRPASAGLVRGVADRMRANRTVLVHGDLSPKNVLVGAHPGDIWVIDWEVAHRGDWTFDVAFLLTHLTLKAIHRPQAASVYDDVAEAFWQAYLPRADPAFLAAQVGCLLLARVVGMSPVEYLSAEQAAAAERLGSRLLSSELHAPSELARLRIETTGVQSWTS